MPIMNIIRIEEYDATGRALMKAVTTEKILPAAQCHTQRVFFMCMFVITEIVHICRQYLDALKRSAVFKFEIITCSHMNT
jgi:hypothetical protein